MQPPEDCRVRRMEPADSDAAFRLASNIPQAAQWPRSEYDMAAHSEYSGWVAVRERDLVGFLVARQISGETEILNIGVAPASRRRGIAARLLATTLEDAKGRGAGKAFLEVRASNAGAIAFYERAGFRETGRRPAYYTNPREDAVLMAFEFQSG